MCICIYIYTHKFTSMNFSPPCYHRLNLITHTLYSHSGQHRKLRPPRLFPTWLCTYPFLAHLLSLLISETFFHCGLWNSFHWVKCNILSLFFKYSLHLPVLAEAWISPEDVTTASNFLKWQLFSLSNCVQPLGWEVEQVSLLFIVLSRPFPVLPP